MKKPDQNAIIKPLPNAWGPDEFKVDYPNLHQFLTSQKWDDGTVRVPGSLSIFVQVGVLKACLNDKDLRRVAFVEAPTWSELIEHCDAAICNGNTEWRGQKSSVPF